MCVHLNDMMCFLTEQARHHSPFNNYNSLHYNEAASPMYSVSESQNHPRDRSSWEDSTREFPASGHSGKSFLFMDVSLLLLLLLLMRSRIRTNAHSSVCTVFCGPA